MSNLIKKLYGVIKGTTLGKKLYYSRELYGRYHRKYSTSPQKFLLANFNKIYIQKPCNGKSVQIAKLLKRVDILPVASENFFYSIDCFKKLQLKNGIFDNYTIDYERVVAYSLNDSVSPNTEYETERKTLVRALKAYADRVAKNKTLSVKYGKALAAIDSLFERGANSFYEALQRILFINQLLWQTNHRLNGLGRLDKILFPLYQKDLENGVLTRDRAKALLADFFAVLHENYWFKSGGLLGDTGQIFILGGVNERGEYECNDLTYMFIEVSMKLKLPDPKVFLRCASSMPDDLLELALKCIATGIGAPFLSNDEAIVPRLIAFGYAPEDAYNYVTAACWEPLIVGSSCDQNNIRSFNFTQPFVRMLDGEELEKIGSFEELLAAYEKYLQTYIEEVLKPLTQTEFEEDPLITLFCDVALQKGKDILRGGAKYANIGLTSVAMGSLVNSLLNLKKHVFETKTYTLASIDKLRRENYADNAELREELKSLYPCYGSDDAEVVELTNRITLYASKEFEKYTTKWGGKFKFGLSSPDYVSQGKLTAATFDGRLSGEPFATHISCDQALPTTELFGFAMKLDYDGNRFNGNVLDFFVSPSFLKANMEKYKLLLKTGFANGLYQLQMNVVDSKTLIVAKANPKLFPNLVVRVWGFSAYFNDLPEEYKDLLIKRALESEKAA